MKTPLQHATSIQVIEALVKLNPKPRSRDFKRLVKLATIWDAYEREHFPTSCPKCPYDGHCSACGRDQKWPELSNGEPTYEMTLTDWVVLCGGDEIKASQMFYPVKSDIVEHRSPR